MQTVSPENATRVLSKVRTGLGLESLAVTGDDALSPDSDAMPTTLRMRHFAAQTLEALNAGIRFQQSTAASWLRVIQAVDAAKDHAMIDVFVLLMIHELISHKKAAETVFLRKAKRGSLLPSLVQATFWSHWSALRPLFKSILSIAEHLMRSADGAAREVAGAL